MYKVNVNRLNWWIPESYLALLWDEAVQRIIVYRWYLVYGRILKKDLVAAQIDVVDDYWKEVESNTDFKEFRDKHYPGNTFDINEERMSVITEPPFGYFGDVGTYYLLMMMRLLNETPADDVSDTMKSYLSELISYFGDPQKKSYPYFLAKWKRI